MSEIEAIQIVIEYVNRKRFESGITRTTEMELQAMEILIDRKIEKLNI